MNLVQYFVLNILGERCYRPKSLREGTMFRTVIIFIGQYINSAVVLMIVYMSIVFPVDRANRNS